MEVIDLMFQVDYVTPKKFRFYEEHDENPIDANFYVIILKQREIEMVSDRNKN